MSEPPSGVAPLSHSAARHKMAVRPRRTHGAPRRKKATVIPSTLALPMTPELNEDLTRCITPDITKSRESSKEYYSSRTMSVNKQTFLTEEITKQAISSTITGTGIPNETKVKSSSLPPGLALSQVVGQSPVKLSLTDNKDVTPQSSIKRSKSTNQGKPSIEPLPEHSVSVSSFYHNLESRQATLTSNISQSISLESELINKDHTVASSREHVTDKYEKKLKADKKNENDKAAKSEEGKNSAKKEESFFSRLLLRKSGKKSKKETTAEAQTVTETKKQQTKSSSQSPQYKSLYSESKSTIAEHSYVRHQKMTCSDENAHKTAGQRAFSNQVHKRMDYKGVYVNESLQKEIASSVVKHAVMECETNDLKYVQTEKRNSGSGKKLMVQANEEFIIPKDTKSDTLLKRNSREHVDRRSSDDLPFVSTYERNKKPKLGIPGTSDQLNSNTFLSNEIASIARENYVKSTKYSHHARDIPKYKMSHEEFVYNGGSMPKLIPHMSSGMKVSHSASPPKGMWPVNLESNAHLRNSSQFPWPYRARPSINESEDRIDSRTFKKSDMSKVRGAYPGLPETSIALNNDLHSDIGIPVINYPEHRNTLGKSHSFRFPSEQSSMDYEENQMPSLPAIVGISEPLMESWETNYRRNLTQDKYVDSSDAESKRLSARNYEVFTTAPENHFESLPSTESSYLDSLQMEAQERMDHHSSYVESDKTLKRQSDISQIEAKIDNIIGSPKSAMVLKCSSLDSVKGLVEKNGDEKKKTISTECALNAPSSEALQGSINFIPKPDPESHVSITHLNSGTEFGESLNTTPEDSLELGKKLSKSEEKIQEKVQSTVPEFLKIQLNKVDAKPATNIVLTANSTPRRSESLNVTLRYDKQELETISTAVNSEFMEETKADKPLPIESKNLDLKTKNTDTEEVNKSVPIIAPYSVQLKKTGSQQLINRSTEFLANEQTQNFSLQKSSTELKVSRPSPLNIKKQLSTVGLPPHSPKFESPVARTFLRKKSPSVELMDTDTLKSSSSSAGVESQNEKIYESVVLEQKSYSSFGSKTSLQSSDSIESKSPDRLDNDGVVFRKKTILVGKEIRNGLKKDDEPELMKVFARRSLKLKDSDVETLTQEIINANANYEDQILEDKVNNRSSKQSKNDYNSLKRNKLIDKENEINSVKNLTEPMKLDNDKARLSNSRKSCEPNDSIDTVQKMKRNSDNSPSNIINNNVSNTTNNRLPQFGITNYQRSVSITSVINNTTHSNLRNDNSVYMKNEVSKYKKEVSDSTPEKRLRNRTFPDLSNDRDDIKTIGAKNEVLSLKCDTASLPKRPWSLRQDNNANKKSPIRNLAYINVDNKEPSSPTNNLATTECNSNKSCEQVCNGEGEADGSPQFKGILQMRAEWERRAKQAMTK